MVSLALRRLTFYHVLLIVVILIGSVTAMAGDENLRQIPISQTGPIELKYGKMSFTLGSSGKFLSRRDGFGYIFYNRNAAPSIWTNRERPNYDSFGGGAEITVGYTIDDKNSIEFSFQGASTGSDSSRAIMSDTNGSDPFVPVIDGQSFGPNQQMLMLSGAPDGTPSISTKLEYDTWYVDTFLGLNRVMLKKTNTELHGIVGLAYAHFEQDFKHTITGTSLTNGLINSSDLDENLRDNLFGLKGGLRLNRRVTKRFQIEGTVFGGAYYRKSKLDADQRLIFAYIPFTGGTLTNVSASVNDRDSHFAPRAEGNLKVKYKINDRWDLAFSSGVSGWWGMSKVNNPEPASGELLATDNPIDKITHIGNDDRLIEYNVGLAITFRH
jgi:hypothetical protein